MTRAVQLVLKSFGYTIAVDGVYGEQTTKVVMKWQKSNGLLVDGIAGPITQASLGLSPAVRQNNAQQVTPPAPAPTRSVEQLIRDIWPDDLEAEALRIAWRESGYQPHVTSRTGCCHGIFQIHEVHFNWMRAFGVTTVDQLFDAETNIRMAYELYKRSNGWGPWKL
jgi:peptidoglycan hydrolase-like protein with peptidoglycan-binding domain